ncbi:MAG TPA: LytTR family DNA-binding domain-containing protein [Phaeodactylibacter sp.]|nr:LytTR family DNA-binding domain-containing protein [Phaeodactylibacter sp.]
MNVLIVEDEELAAERLQQLINELQPEAKVQASLDSVEDTVRYLQRQPDLDLAFFDIQLADGLSFQIFKQAKVPCPVVFTTAYDQYTLQAFKVNSVDYLLKPIDREELGQSLKQFEELRSVFNGGPALERVEQALSMLQKDYKTRFVVKAGHQFLSIKTSSVLYFFSEHKMTWLRHRDGKKHQLDYSLEQLEQLLDPTQFYRVNRQHIVQIESVEQATIYSNARLKLMLSDGKEVLVSRDRVGGFRKWMGE